MDQISKFICGIFEAGGAEQAIAFPAELQHDAVWNYVVNGNPQAKPVSAGFFHETNGQVDLVFGNSESMDHHNGGQPLPSRPQVDRERLQELLSTQAKERYDLRLTLYFDMHKQSQILRPARPAISMA